MASVRIGTSSATTVGRLLKEIGENNGVAPDVRQNASRYASTVRRRMDRRDVEGIASIFRVVSTSGDYPSSRRERAQYWATYLENRI